MQSHSLFFEASTGAWSAPLPDADSPRTLVFVTVDCGLAESAAVADASARALDALSRAYPNALLVGASRRPDAATPDSRITASISQLTNTDVQRAVVEVSSSAFTAARDAAVQLAARPGLRAVILLTDGSSADRTEARRGLGAALDSSVVVAVDDAPSDTNWLAVDTVQRRGVVAAIGFYGDHILLGDRGRGGWAPHGPMMAESAVPLPRTRTTPGAAAPNNAAHPASPSSTAPSAPSTAGLLAPSTAALSAPSNAAPSAPSSAALSAPSSAALSAPSTAALSAPSTAALSSDARSSADPALAASASTVAASPTPASARSASAAAASAATVAPSSRSAASVVPSSQPAASAVPSSRSAATVVPSSHSATSVVQSSRSAASVAPSSASAATVVPSSASAATASSPSAVPSATALPAGAASSAPLSSAAGLTDASSATLSSAASPEAPLFLAPPSSMPSSAARSAAPSSSVAPSAEASSAAPLSAASSTATASDTASSAQANKPRTRTLLIPPAPVRPTRATHLAITIPPLEPRTHDSSTQVPLSAESDRNGPPVSTESDSGSPNLIATSPSAASASPSATSQLVARPPEPAPVVSRTSSEDRIAERPSRPSAISGARPRDASLAAATLGDTRDISRASAPALPRARPSSPSGLDARPSDSSIAGGRTDATLARADATLARTDAGADATIARADATLARTDARADATLARSEARADATLARSDARADAGPARTEARADATLARTDTSGRASAPLSAPAGPLSTPGPLSAPADSRTSSFGAALGARPSVPSLVPLALARRPSEPHAAEGSRPGHHSIFDGDASDSLDRNVGHDAVPYSEPLPLEPPPSEPHRRSGRVSNPIIDERFRAVEHVNAGDHPPLTNPRGFAAPGTDTLSPLAPTHGAATRSAPPSAARESAHTATAGMPRRPVVRVPRAVGTDVTVETARHGEVQLVTMRGRISEAFRGEPVGRTLSGTIAIDVGDIDRVTSYGVREWIAMLTAAGATASSGVPLVTSATTSSKSTIESRAVAAFGPSTAATVPSAVASGPSAAVVGSNSASDASRATAGAAAAYLFRCSESIVNQLTLIRRFAGTAQIASFFAPYLCGGCGTEFERLFDCERDAAELRSSEPSAVTCPRCGADASFDEDPRTYFAFAAGAIGASLPPDVRAVHDSLLDGTDATAADDIEKLVESDATFVRLRSALSSHLRWRRIFDGVEGRLVIDLESMSGGDAAGATNLEQALRALPKIVSPVEVRHAPVSLVASLVANDLARRIDVESAVVSGYCAACGTHRPAALSLSAYTADRDAGRTHAIRCKRCNGELTLSVDPVIDALVQSRARTPRASANLPAVAAPAARTPSERRFPAVVVALVIAIAAAVAVLVFLVTHG